MVNKTIHSSQHTALLRFFQFPNVRLLFLHENLKVQGDIISKLRILHSLANANLLSELYIMIIKDK